MGRSVDYDSDAVVVVYLDASHVEDEWEWDEYIDDIRNVICSKYKSLAEADGWKGRELRTILSSDLAEVHVAEYCGLVSVSLSPREFSDYYTDEIALKNLSDGWLSRVSKGFEKLLNESFGGLRKIGTASNGESFFEKAK